MRVFTLSVVVAVLLAAAFWLGLDSIQQSVADAYSTASTRVGQL